MYMVVICSLSLSLSLSLFLHRCPYCRPLQERLACSDDEAVRKMLAAVKEEQGNGTVMTWYEEHVAGARSTPTKKRPRRTSEGD